jgi:D-tyrosyl-tRNA(Tyr) deacylase
MRALIQRVSSASVSIEGEDSRANGGNGERLTNHIERGYLILLGVGKDDTDETARKLWGKIAKLRIFDDENGKTNLSIAQVGGEVLLVSQFTLYADAKKGNRPSFTAAAGPDEANRLYEYFGDLVETDGFPCERGWFGARMRVELVNDGPFTIWLDTDTL